jgi:ubiquinone/menaquinone biosynthesis C-methylase UbiE
MQTDYAGHERAYQRFKAEGKVGWNTRISHAAFQTAFEGEFQTTSVPKSGKLLELGCGAGEYSLWLAEKGYEVSGVDIAPTAIAWAQERAQERRLQIDFRVGNVLDLQDYSDSVFDVVLDGHCFHCIIGTDRPKFLASVWRVLKPGGFFLTDNMCGDVRESAMRPEHRAMFVFDPETRCSLFRKTGIASRYIGVAEEIVDEIRQAGFHVIHWDVRSGEATQTMDYVMVAAQKL